MDDMRLTALPWDVEPANTMSNKHWQSLNGDPQPGNLKPRPSLAAASQCEGLWLCDHCPKTFDTLGMKDHHMAQAHAVIMVEDLPSDTETTPEVNRKRQRSEHDGLGVPKRQRLSVTESNVRWPGSYCSETFETDELKDEHATQAHPGLTSKPNVKCWQCSAEFVSIRGLAKHVSQEHKLPQRTVDAGNQAKGEAPRVKKPDCPICFVPQPKTDIRLHIKTQHPAFWNDSLTTKQMARNAASAASKNQVARLCPFCRRKIRSTEKALRKHIREDHPDRWDGSLTADKLMDPARKPKNLETRWASCPSCHKRYTEDGLKRHVELKHNSTEGPVPASD